jgi:hypothetical protein
MHHADGVLPPGETWHKTIEFYTGPLVQDEGKPLEMIDPSTVSDPIALHLEPRQLPIAHRPNRHPPNTPRKSPGQCHL